MAKKVFKNIKDLKNYSRQVASKVLQTKVAEEAEKYLLDAIQTAYNEYSSDAHEKYDRRYANGGLSDPRTIARYISSDGLSIRIRQETTSDTGGLLFVDVYVTQGDLYNWSNSKIYKKQPYPRDFYEYARVKLEEELPKIVQKAFRDYNIKTEKIKINVRRR